MRRLPRSAFLLGVVAGLIVALVRALAKEARSAPAALPAPPAPLPPAPEPVAATPTWVEPVEGGCPDGYPIKAKRSSGIYHRPGGLSYARTNPDRCYASEAAAEADGFRPAKR